MHGIQPQALTDAELAKYAELYTFAQLPDNFKAEIIARYVMLTRNQYRSGTRTETNRYHTA